MKISKQPKQAVKASEIAPDTTVISSPLEVPTQGPCPYTQAKEFIQSAISSLATVAGNDPVAKDSIANLAVVLLDLQSC